MICPAACMGTDQSTPSQPMTASAAGTNCGHRPAASRPSAVSTKLAEVEGIPARSLAEHILQVLKQSRRPVGRA